MDVAAQRLGQRIDRLGRWLSAPKIIRERLVAFHYFVCRGAAPVAVQNQSVVSRVLEPPEGNEYPSTVVALRRCAARPVRSSHRAASPPLW
jgi:hypothetical protein